MITLEQITLSMGEQIEQIRMNSGHTASSHAFVSLFIWQKEMNLKICLRKQSFAVRYGLMGENAWFFPCGSKEGKKELIRELMEDRDVVFYFMREEDILFLEEEYPGAFLIEECRDDHEYLYSRMEQQDLQGRRFAGQRNHIRRALREGNLCVQNICEDNIALVSEICCQWERHNDAADGLTDDDAVKRLVENWKILGLGGVLVFFDGEPYSVAAGYSLSEDTYDLALAKQKSFIAGLSVFTRHEMICRLPERYQWINAEEDLGIEGLRTMKSQMNPVDKIRMYKGRLK